MKARDIVFFSLAVILLLGNHFTMVDLDSMTRGDVLLNLLANRIPRLILLLFFARLGQPMRDLAIVCGVLFLADIVATGLRGPDHQEGMDSAVAAARWVMVIMYNFVTALLLSLQISLRRSRNLLTQVIGARKLLNDVVNTLPIGVGAYQQMDELLFINETGYNMLELDNQAPYDAKADYNPLMQTQEGWRDFVSLLWREVNADAEKTGEQVGGTSLLQKTLPSRDGQRLLHVTYGKLELIQADKRARAGLLVVVRDVTEREKLIKQLTQAKDKAEKSSQAKSHFLANVSHELRTPITSILGFSQLATVHEDMQSKDLADMLTTISRNGEGLLHLVNDILDLSKAEANRLTLIENEADPRLVIYDEVNNLRPQLEVKDLSISLLLSHDVATTLCFDEGKVRQVLRNLLANAIKFTHQGGITLSCWSSDVLEWQGQNIADIAPVLARTRARTEDHLATAEDRVMLHIEVADTGAGIAPEELANLFEPFMQTRSGISSKQGTGLGLAISKKFTTFLGGDIIIDSHVGEGTRCHFWFSAKRVATDS